MSWHCNELNADFRRWSLDTTVSICYRYARTAGAPIRLAASYRRPNEECYLLYTHPSASDYSCNECLHCSMHIAFHYANNCPQILHTIRGTGYQSFAYTTFVPQISFNYVVVLVNAANPESGHAHCLISDHCSPQFNSTANSACVGLK